MSEIAIEENRKAGIRKIFGIRGARDSYGSTAYSFLFGQSSSGKVVNEQTAMQTTAVYSCVRILSEAIASLPVHLYRRHARICPGASFFCGWIHIRQFAEVIDMSADSLYNSY